MATNPAWKTAFRTAVDFRRNPAKIDSIEAGWSDLPQPVRRRAHRLVYAWLRERGRAEALLAVYLQRPPRLPAVTLLELAVAEMLVTAPDRHPAVVDHAVSAARQILSQPESRLANAVLRKVAADLTKAPPALVHSHPPWLVERWQKAFGRENTEHLLRWNQEEAEWLVRLVPGTPVPEEWHATPWPGFHRVEVPHRSAALALVDEGKAYVQDPFTRHPVDLAMGSGPATVLDLCAAPGGKTRAVLDSRGSSSLTSVVAVDLPGPRLGRLRENVARSPRHDLVRIIGADVRQLQPDSPVLGGSPSAYDAVILDVPCSNTGVIRRRPDVRWLIRPENLAALVETQRILLKRAAAFVAPDGSLIYSTCSLEQEENARQIEWFLQEHPDFTLTASHLSLPWRDHHDGGAAFRLTRHGWSESFAAQRATALP